ncbi:MAG: cbb3-type cytochrome oxidase assembly protein CcoS [Balneolaceae bacterium]
MGVIILLIAFSLLVALTFLGAFFWAVKSGQFDDPETPSMRMLFDDKPISQKNKTLTNKTD